MAHIDRWQRLSVLCIAVLLLALPVFFILDWGAAPILACISAARFDAGEVKRLRFLAAEKPGYQAALATARNAMAGENMPDASIPATLASAQLQSKMQMLVGQLGQPVSSIEITPPQTAQGLQALGVSLSFNLPPAQLPVFLASIDAQRPYLFVQSLDIHATDNGAGTGLLNVQLQLSEFRDGP